MNKLPRSTVAVLSCAFACVAHAQLDSSLAPEAGGKAHRGETLPRLEVAQTPVHRLDGGDAASHTSRVDLSLHAPTRSGLGLTVGMSGFNSNPSGAASNGQPGLNVDLGVQWRHMTDANHRVDISAYRRISPEPDAFTLAQMKQPSTYVARVELNMAPVKKTGLVVDRGIGLQLESGARITLRRSNGKPMVYYRSTF